jgi:hypothetical protein
LSFHEDGQDYWMLVEDSLLPPLEDFKAGQWVGLSVRLLGSFEENPGYRAIFVITGILD